MKSLNAFFETLYSDFNDRNIDLVIANLSENVKWANGMEGGYVYGHDGVRAYWKRQFAQISSKVTPFEIKGEKNTVFIKAHQVVHDVTGRLVSDLHVNHIFHLEQNKIIEFEIG